MSDDDDESIGEEFGQRHPPLSIYIKGILERYPDGQIFKEMIQNADDAGATIVQFFVDARQHGTDTVVNRKLKQCQGPALISANNAVFKEEDWQGIQKPQQSIKADDPFKVGRFGIGFNSVYHITDIPTIISGETVAYLDPQEKVWINRSGRKFPLSKLQGKYHDALAPFTDVAGFRNDTEFLYYPKTLFRFPLRKSPSELSENIYSLERLEELIDALRGEANLLLPFLRSVDTIEVHRISCKGRFSPIFKVEIAELSKASLKSERQWFLKQLKAAHSRQSYGISSLIDFIADFHIEVTDHCARNRNGSTHFLVAATVGSSSSIICKAAKKQKAFPWVGTALQLDAPFSNSGRIFCFLPMPVDAASKLPVHVNGTFGLNDDRRSMKWPGPDRKNDPTANWNELLVSQLLPNCYVKLLIKAKDIITPAKFYEAWPEVTVIKGTHWDKILCPLFSDLFIHSVLWSERTEALRQTGEWVGFANAVLTPPKEKLPSVLHRALSDSGIKLVTVPKRVWDGLALVKKAITEVSPKLARKQFRNHINSYVNVDPIGKGILLRYCLKDKHYNDLQGIVLLPLANENFVPFQQRTRYTSKVYICNTMCPRYLLPNLDHILVDVGSNDQSLHDNLSDVAASNCTQLAMLTVNEVAKLLPRSMPSAWQSSSGSVESLANSNFPTSWFESFWKWVKHYNLKLFQNQFVLLVGTNSVARLKPNQAIIYILQYSSCSQHLLSVFDKLGVMYCLQSRFPYLQHKSLSQYLNKYDANGILDSIHMASRYNGTALTKEEAQALSSRLAQDTPSMTSQRNSVILGLAMFSLTPNSSQALCSPNTAASCPLKRAIIEPTNLCTVVKQLPSNFLLFSQNDYSELRLLQLANVECPTDTKFLCQCIFPLMSSKVIPDHCVDPIMNEILHIGTSLVMKDHNFRSSLSQLAFVQTASGFRQSPINLFDPSNTKLAELYKGENVFPTEPYNSQQWLQFLKQSCGLRTSVTPNEVLSIISAIKLPARSYPQMVNQTYLSRAKAVLKYISTPNFQLQATGKYSLREHRGYMRFSTALNYYASNYSWLPVLPERPPDYPTVLAWKGEGYSSHFFTLDNQGAVMTSSNKELLPFIIGSQMYVTDSANSTSTQLNMSDSSLCTHVIAHLHLVISNCHGIPLNLLPMMVGKVYSFLSQQNVTQLKQPLQSIENWIYIRKYKVFVSPSVIAINPNSNFRHDLEPYLYTLPESLSVYHDFFTRFGVNLCINQSQIITVLKMIKESIDKNNTTLSSSNVWSLVMAILNWLTDNGTKTVSISTGDQIYVPTESDSEWPQLMEAGEVVYTDNDFLKRFLSSSSSDDYTFVHRHISANLANSLGLTPLSDFLDITEDTFEDTGQHEPLTVRLKNILKDYKDGLTIAKELLQNADDAEADKVNFCYDARTHSVESSSLFFPEMLQSHGPALLVHNNKTFSKDDFENITKLAGATKQNKPLKIGKFGIGFCSVYHITDVPSFISRDTLTIFDPTMSYLKKEIKNPSRPGKKVRYTSQFIRKSKQLIPYDGLFDFNPQQEYSGTLFRLPFRTAASELSGTCYTEDHHVKHLISEMTACSTNLILFLQHVETITFQIIRNGESEPTITLKITKAALPIRDLPTHTSIKEIMCVTPQTSTISSHWMVSKFSTHVNNKHATASVAAPLLQTSSEEYTTLSNEGEVFCFLPLSQKTGLPVHISGNFAVINNRRGIWTSDDTTSLSNEEVLWNISLMESVIPIAYHQLLLSIQSSSMIENYLFYTFWPLEETLKSKNPWIAMIRKLYQMIATLSKLFYSNNTAEWLTLNESKFLAAGIICQSSASVEHGDDGCITDVVKCLNLPVVNLPMSYRAYFQLVDYTITEKDFLSLFFNNLDKLKTIKESRNHLILRMLEVYAAECDDATERMHTFQNYFQCYASIPCAPDGDVLKKCNQLIDPNSPFAKLYDTEENRFPTKELTERHLAHTSLAELGMVHTKLPYTAVVERAETIASLYNQDRCKAMTRIKLILRTVEFSMKDNEGNPDVTLDSIPFLPVLSKPCDYPLVWAGDGCELMFGKDLVVYSAYSNENNGIIAGSQVSFVNESSEEGCGRLSIKLQNILQVRTSPTCHEVIQQLRELIKTFESQATTEKLKTWTNKMCQQIYKFLDDRRDYEEIESFQELTRLPCIWTGKKFLTTNQVAKLWKLDGPYLHEVPSLLLACHNLCKALSIKEDFNISDVENALIQMKEDFGDQPVDEESQVILKELVSYFLKIKPDKFSDFKILLPDENYILMWSSDLAYNDAPWAPRDESHRYVNDIIPRITAMQLHVKPVRAKLLEKYANPNSQFRGIEFGQKEELTRRIQNILKDYPFDVTVLKELLQNADDAKASKMCIILDKRNHGKQSVLSESWYKLQGPALLVWNDSIFSEKDIEGIQELGLGSKRSEADSIGQYGIGFNSVYHLTDCPSFVSNGNTLCVMDPHCTFVHGATPLNPGRQFDKLNSGFWEEFKDMKSAYLRSNITDVPSELLGGSLFRFPLRSTYDSVRSSKIADNPTNDILTSEKMEALLDKWAPKMKAAMFFLNNVRELHFYIIEEHSTALKTQYHYCIDISSLSRERCDFLQQKLSVFKKQSGCESCVVRYPITIIDKSHSSSGDKKQKEKWIIQQGIGDIEKQDQSWTFVKQVKPRHGIAAPLDNIKSAKVITRPGRGQKQLDGQVFCFLPLPIHSRLPVHINGHFVLNSTRRQLWQSTNLDDEDGRTIWNKNLLSAIASSYADFLNNSCPYFVSEEYSKANILRDDVENYYTIFPEACAESLDKKWLALVKECYEKVYQSNPSILAVARQADPDQKTTGSDTNISVSWHPILSVSPSSQVYFWIETCQEKKTVQPVLEAVGMKITLAPFKIRNYINDAVNEGENKCPEISPSSVYTYYTQFYSQVTSNQFPCDIAATTFHSVNNFKIFTRYILDKSTSSDFEEFPDTPFGYPLLVTADGKLRKFDQNNKAFFSHFVEHFRQSAAYFVHPDLLDIQYSKAYFVAENCDYSLIHRILSENLPQCLCDAEKCSDAKLLIPIQKLQNLWLCFSLDPAFSSSLKSILHRWALILTTDNQLFSNACQLHPILPLSHNDVSNRSVFQVFTKIRMPIVDTSVIVSTIGTNCPNISEYAKVLSCLFHLNKDTDLSTKLSSDDILILVRYLKSINFRTEEVSCQQIKSLPIFENVDGKFTAVSGLRVVYIWPVYCSCKSAYSKWIRGYSMVFLKKYASWSELCSPSELGIEEIATEDMYIKYIFPHFHLMSESERYEHLRYIREDLFYSNKTNMLHRNLTVRQRAISFVNALQKLDCIGEDEHPLHPVSHFCDHEREIFTTFSKHFNFLPKYFTSNPPETYHWMKFFRALGLKTTIAHDEFVTFCTETAEGKHADVRKASSVLINALFSAKEEWYNYPGFLYRISRISFLCSEELPSLIWISPAATSKTIKASDCDGIAMTEPFKAARVTFSDILWTVKPIVKLPATEDILAKLSVCMQPSTSDVIENLRNICKLSKFADISLFDKFPSQLKPPEGGCHLSSVFLEHFNHLQGKISGADINVLKSIPCIPVYASPDQNSSSEMVLVKPHSVVTCDVSGYHPFLYKLPHYFIYVTPLMELIGVKRELDLNHMQIVLQSAYQCSSGKELEVNTNECVKKAVEFIYKLLLRLNDDNQSKSLDDDITEKLSPLYLPSKNKTLVLSTSLLYHDAPHFFDMHLKLSNTNFTELDISSFDYGFYRTQFCSLLPPSIRPIGTSRLCIAKVAPECSPCDPSELARKVSTCLCLSSLPTAIVTIVKHNIPKDKKVNDSIKHLQPCMETLLKDIDVVTYKDLKIITLLKATEAVIGSGKMPYFMDETEGHTLCLDVTLKGGTTVSHVYSAIANLVLSSIQKICPISSPSDLKKTIEFLLRAESTAQIVQELRRRCLPIGEVTANENVKLSIGMEIPHEWHYRLDQDIDNLFHANEYVGYEDCEGHYILVKIIHVMLEQGQDILNQYARRYLIFTMEEDQEGIEVGVLSLYKFIKGEKKVKVAQESHAVVPYEGNVTTSSRTEYSDGYLKQVKRNLCKELKEIWKLNLEDRKKALRRLYLKWHPDRNPDNPDFTEKVYKFLRTQIERLEQGLSLDDPDDEQTAHAYHSTRSSRTWWWGQFREWDRTANQHRWYYARDYEHSRGGSRDSHSDHHQWSRNRGFGWGHSFGWNQGSPFTAGDDNFRVPRQPGEGQRWISQAKYDHRLLIIVYDQMTSLNDNTIAGHVCFLAHQVAEKALKAGMYAFCGLEERNLKDYVLARHAYALQTEKPGETLNLACHASSLEKYYLDTRYPNRHVSPAIPALAYSLSEAEEAKEHGTKIFSIISSLFDDN